MKLSELLNNIPKNLYDIIQLNNKEIVSISIDSRDVKKGTLFIALPGTRSHGCKYITDAIQKGASAILIPEECLKEINFKDIKNITIITSKNIIKTTATIVPTFFDNPSKKLKVIGITGTNGKTTCCFIIDSILKNANQKTAISGTIFQKILNKKTKSALTTPDIVSFHRFLKEAFNKGVEYVITEVSSHALTQGRTEGCKYEVALFTNLSHDHLDYHKNFDDYFRAKSILFKKFRPNFSIINIDDPYGKKLFNEIDGKKISYGLTKRADIYPTSYKFKIDGLWAQIKAFEESFEISSHLIGKHNLYNILASIAVAYSLKIPKHSIISGIYSLKSVQGRLEPVFLKNIRGFIDYAHTPDAVKNVLITLNDIKKDSSKIITVIGCGGDRDKAKRPQMAKIASQYSDFVIFTTDNPRTESPSSIIKDMLKGIEAKAIANIRIIEDRKEAITFAAFLAKKEDILLITGKGHEDYQIIGKKTLPFSDKEELTKALLKRTRENQKLQIQPFLFNLLCATGGKCSSNKIDIQISGVSTDSREIKPKQVFFALEGERFDGHDFLDIVIKKGACAAVVNRDKVPSTIDKDFPYVLVKDTLYALGEYAKWYKSFLGLKTIGITGSCGKTTTKELIFNVISKKYPVSATKGNYNNLIGLPLTIFDITPGTEWAVLEMGTNLPGEIKRLCEIAQPQIGIITCIAPVHLEGLKTLEGVSHEKGFLFESLPENGTAIVNTDDPFVLKNLHRTKAKNLIAYGQDIKKLTAIKAKKKVLLKESHNSKDGLYLYVNIEGSYYHFKSKLFGQVNAQNICCAIATALALNIPIELIQQGIENTPAQKGRMNIKKEKGWIIIDDTYNANPHSVKAGLEFLIRNFEAEKKNLILGDMLELGESSQEYHYKIGEIAGAIRPMLIMAIGEFAPKIKEGALSTGFPKNKIIIFNDVNEAMTFLIKDNKLFFNGTKRLVYLKGSRGVGLDKLLSPIKEKISGAN